MKRFLILALLCGVAAAKPAAPAAKKAPKPAEPVFVCSNGIYSLHEAALVGDTVVIAKRLNEGKAVNELDELSNTPLALAALANQTEAVKALLAEGGDVTIANAEGKTPTQLTTSPEVRKLLQAAELVRAKEVALSKSIAAGDKAAVEAGLNAGINPNAQAADPSQGTLLLQAIAANQLEIAQLLLDKGAKATVKSPEGKTALHAAAGANAAGIIPTLLAAGADPMAQAGNGATALHDAVWSNRLEAIKALLPAYKGCNFNPDGGWQPNAPAMACGRGDAILMAFADAGIDPNAPITKNGDTFLMLCVRNHAGADVIKALMAKGADPTLKDNDGKSAADTADDNTKPLLTK